MNGNVTWMDFNDAGLQQTETPQRNLAAENEEIKSRLTTRIEEVLFHLLPSGKSRYGKFLIGDVEGNPGESMKVELTGDKAGVWYDHAVGHGGDILDLWAKVRGMNTHADFPRLMEDIRGWLGEPIKSFSAPSPSQKKPAMDDLGPPTGKWDYFDQDGSLLVCVYRYDPPGKKKEFRPWDVRSRKWQAPEIRPLYNLPGILGSSQVVLVEGEKTAQALIDIGIVATTSMHGSNSPVDKTDWSPLAGKQVTIWPDKDKAGWDYAKAVTIAVQKAGANTTSMLSPPSDKPEKWDAADAVAEGVDIHEFLATANKKEFADSEWRINLQEWTFDRYKGPPPKREWLIEGILPLGVPGMMAASGGAGKSMLLMDLAAKVAMVKTESSMPIEALGGALVPMTGTAVMLTSEDDEAEVHRRIARLVNHMPDPTKLIIVPLPSAGGTWPLIATSPVGLVLTDEYFRLREALLDIPDLRLVVIDPLQNFAGGDVNKDPAAAALFFSGMGRIAAETGATTLLTHHFRKGGTTVTKNAQEARDSIRGTSALVDGGRWAYALWEVAEEEAKKFCKQLGLSYERDSVFRGAVVKSNWPVDKTERTYVRNSSTGLLIDKTIEHQIVESERTEILDELVSQIAQAAINGQPFTRTSANGLYERRSELSGELARLSKHRLSQIADILLASGRVVLCTASGSQLKKWLDIPGGVFSLGTGQFRTGSGLQIRGEI